MNSASDELWLAFREEVGEQLDNLDMELLRGIEQCDIHQVFRDFHTIKSSCAMLDLVSMKELAHISEDYLDLVRKQVCELTEEGLDALLTAVETLKNQLAVAAATRANPEPATGIVHTLHALVAAGAEAAASAAAGGDAHASGSAVVAADPAFLALADSCRQAMLQLGDSSQVAAALTPALRSALIEMGNMAELMEFPVITELVRDIVKAWREVGDGGDDTRLLHLKAELLERLRLLETGHAVDCGALAAEGRWRQSLRQRFLKGILALVDVIDSLGRTTDTAVIAQHCDAIASGLDRLACYATLCGLQELTGLLRYVCQIAHSVRRGYFPASPALATALGHAVDLPYAALLDDGEAQLTEVIAEAFRELERFVAGALRETAGAGQDPDAQPVMDERFRAGLDSDSSTLLSQAVDSGKSLFEIDLDMTNELPAVEALLEWISQNGTIVHNISSFHNREVGGQRVDEVHIIFLVAFELPLEAIRDELLVIDPAASFFTIRPHAASAPEKTASAAPAADSASTSAAAQEIARATSGSLRVSSRVLDELVSQLGEVVMVRNRVGMLVSRDTHEALRQRARQLLDKLRQQSVSSDELAELRAHVQALQDCRENLKEADLKLQVAISNIQQRVLDLREMPLSLVLNRLPNIVRKQAQALGRKVELKLHGGDVRVDKGMLDLLLDPLVQLAANAVEHGIESPAVRQKAGKSPQGSLTVTAGVDNGLLFVQVSDDGAGIPAELLNNAGDSSTPGGLRDIRALLGRLGGQLQMESHPGQGLTVMLRFPQTVAMQQVMLLRSRSGLVGVPERNVAEVITLSPAAVQELQGQLSITHEQRVIPLVSIDTLAINGAPADSRAAATEELRLVIIAAGEHRLAVSVEAVAGVRQTYVPDTHPVIADVHHIGGITILGDGSVVPILNMEYLADAVFQCVHPQYRSQAQLATPLA